MDPVGHTSVTSEGPRCRTGRSGAVLPLNCARSANRRQGQEGRRRRLQEGRRRRIQEGRRQEGQALIPIGLAETVHIELAVAARLLFFGSRNSALRYAAVVPVRSVVPGEARGRPVSATAKRGRRREPLRSGASACSTHQSRVRRVQVALCAAQAHYSLLPVRATSKCSIGRWGATDVSCSELKCVRKYLRL